MKPGISGSAFFFALILLVGQALSEELTVEPFYQGTLAKRPQARSALIRDEGTLETAREALGIKDTLPRVDFANEALLLIISREETGGVIEIRDIETKTDGVMEVLYTGQLTGPPPEGKTELSIPYLFSIIRPVPGQNTTVRFIAEDSGTRPAPGTAMGQFEPYTNVLVRGENLKVAEYVPLDKGNVWTYAVKSGDGTREITNTIISVSDGWSVFDEFFGVPYVGMKITPAGEIYVRSKGGPGTFYNSDAVTEFPDSGVTTPAGRFDKVMVVSIPEGGEFWFRDVYAKGVGLVLHEHRSPRGDAEYRLTKATVGGRDYPAGD